MAEENRSIIVNGVGTLFTKNADNDKLAPLGTLQSIKFDFTVSKEPVYGGDGLYPLDHVIKDKAVVVTAVNTKFDLNTLRVATGAEISVATGDDAYTWVLNKMGTVVKVGDDPFTYEVDISDNGTVFADDPAISILSMETGAALEEKETGTPDSGKFYYDSTGKTFEFNADMEGKNVMYSYKITATNVALAEGLQISLPVPVTIIHQGAFKQKNNVWQGIETEIKLATANGTFTIDYARATASASNLALDMIDPEDGTCRLWTMKRFVTSAPPCM